MLWHYNSLAYVAYFRHEQCLVIA